MKTTLNATETAALQYFACVSPFGSPTPSAEVEASLRVRGMLRGMDLSPAGIAALVAAATNGEIMAAVRAAYNASKDGRGEGTVGAWQPIVVKGITVAHIRYGYRLRGVNRFDSFKWRCGDRVSSTWHRVGELSGVVDHISGTRSWW